MSSIDLSVELGRVQEEIKLAPHELSHSEPQPNLVARVTARQLQQLPIVAIDILLTCCPASH